jgi:BirA family biotin operon repressor/biotin-[acetyl-CoA-carboxylase] ligase
MCGRRKLAGILVQMSGGAPVAGIGINLNHESFPTELAELATSLRIETGAIVPPEDLLAALLRSVDRECKILVEEGREATIRRFTQASSYAQCKRVTVDLPEGQVTGITAGLDPAGFLRLRRDDGGETLILAGGVREV